MTLIDPVTGALFGDYHIQNGSSAIGAGDNVIVSLTPELASDFDGDPRPSGPGVDIGADELAAGIVLLNACPGDFDNDGDVDGGDLATFGADFGRTDCGAGPPCPGDFDNDGDVDGGDLTTFAADFGRTDCMN